MSLRQACSRFGFSWSARRDGTRDPRGRLVEFDRNFLVSPKGEVLDNLLVSGEFSTCTARREGEGDAMRKLNLCYKDILDAQRDNKLIIDVREEAEISETGKLPGSIHIPMGEVANVLRYLSKEEFKEKFGKEKPSVDSKIILSCRSGKRSGTVQEELLKMGYSCACNYVGGWLDWESNNNNQRKA